MKVALCLSGQLRTFEKTYELIYNNIIVPNNADVFIHSWITDENTYFGTDPSRIYITDDNSHLKALELYKPKKYLFEKPKSFKNYHHLKIPIGWQNTCKSNIINPSAHIATQTVSMFYGIYKCNELKEDYANENNITYDAVIRLRFDAIIPKQILISNFNLNNLYYQNLNHPDNIISDWINIGNNNIMNIFSSIFLYIGFLNNLKQNEHTYVSIHPDPDCFWGNEYLIYEIIKRFSIKSLPYDFKASLLYK
jgi:hypothetical protein